MRCLFILILFWLVGPASKTLHSQTAGGNISGVVSDPSVASVPQAKVVLRNLATEIVRKVAVNLDGLYTAPNLVPGEYEVTVSAVGFETQVAHLTMRIGAEEELNFALRIGAVDRTMGVEGSAAGGLAAPALGAVVNQRAIGELPSTAGAGPIWPFSSRELR